MNYRAASRAVSRALQARTRGKPRGMNPTRKIQAMPGFRRLARIRLRCGKGSLIEGVTTQSDGKKRSLVTFPFSKTRVEQIEQVLGQRRRRKVGVD